MAKARFIHMADIHLGNRQYGSDERENDFARSWLWMCDQVVEVRPQFALISGDLFHHADVSPLTLLQAQAGLQKMQDASVPVFAIEGNHDRSRLMDSVSWLQYLDRKGLLKLLYAEVSEQGVTVADEMVKGTRIIGVQYSGASTPRVLGMLAADLPSDDCAQTVLMLHGGLEEAHHFGANFEMADIEPLRGKVDYIALGHIHQSYERDGWVWNPGAPESNAGDEYGHARGMFIVDLEDHELTVQPLDVISRHFVRFEVDVTNVENPAEMPEYVLFCVKDEIKSGVRMNLSETPPVIDVALAGTLQFSRTALDISAITTLLEEKIEAVVVRVNNKTVSIEADMNVWSDATREEIEHQALKDIFEADSRYKANASEMVDLAIHAKEAVLQGDGPQSLDEAIREVLR